jgi:hypothetical protein
MVSSTVKYCRVDLGLAALGSVTVVKQSDGVTLYAVMSATVARARFKLPVGLDLVVVECVIVCCLRVVKEEGCERFF